MNREEAKEWLDHVLPHTNTSVHSILYSDSNCIIRYMLTKGPRHLKIHKVNPWEYFPWLISKKFSNISRDRVVNTIEEEVDIYESKVTQKDIDPSHVYDYHYSWRKVCRLDKARRDYLNKIATRERLFWPLRENLI